MWFSILDLNPNLSTALVADACVRLEISFHVAPFGIRPLTAGMHVAGRVRPVRHAGSVDIILEAMETGDVGDVLVIDNGGRTDEGCIGDLTVLEGGAAGLAGFIVWGCHRDSASLGAINLPVFSYGACPAGPRHARPRDPEALVSACFGPVRVDRNDIVLADDDGVLFLPLKHADSVFAMAKTIRQTEQAQAEAIASGFALREQLRFHDYLEQRRGDPSLTFREHLNRVGGAIET